MKNWRLPLPWDGILSIHLDVKMSPVTKENLTNKELIALDQDPLGKQGYKTANPDRTEVWMKPLVGGAWGVGLYNRNDVEMKNITIRWSDLGLALEMKASVRDLWTHGDQGVFSGSFSRDVMPHECIVLKIKPV